MPTVFRIMFVYQDISDIVDSDKSVKSSLKNPVSYFIIEILELLN